MNHAHNRERGDRWRQSVAIASIVAGVAGSAALFLWLFNLTLPAGPGSWEELRPWLASTDPADMIAVIARILGLAASGYLGVSLTLGVISEACLPRSLRGIIQRALPRAVTTITATAILGSGVAGAGTPDLAAPAQNPDSPPTMQLREPSRVPTQPVPTQPVTADLEAPPTMQRGELPDSVPAVADSAAPVQEPLPESGALAEAAAAVVAQPGDHLWGIAERDLAGELGRTPTEAETHRHWSQLVERNRHQLVDPDNPDLIFAGQVFELPR